jgi:hypothetical protein
MPCGHADTSSSDLKLLLSTVSVSSLLQTAIVTGGNVRCGGSSHHNHHDAVLLLFVLYSVQEASASCQWW